MASLLRHSVGSSPSATSPLGMSSTRRPVTCTVVSREEPHGDCSFLIIRERPALMPSESRLILRGDFGVLTRNRLATLLTSLPADRPLHVDLRRVTTLDEDCLGLLLKARRDHSPRGSVVFQVAEVGPVRRMIRGLGLEKNLGLEIRLGMVESPVPKTGGVSAAPSTGQRSKTAPANGVVLPT